MTHQSFQENKKAPLNTDLIVEIIQQLNITRKNVGLYPPGHPSLKAAMARVINVLKRHFAFFDELSFGVTAGQLLVDDEILDEKNPIIREMASFFHSLSIFSFSLKKGINADELLLLYRIFAEDSVCKTPSENVSQAASRHGLPHVSVEVLDYDSLCFTEEKEVSLGKGEGVGGTTDSTWEDFVRNLLCKDEDITDLAVFDGVAISKIPADQLASFLNTLVSRDLNLSYEKVIRRYLKEIEDEVLLDERSLDNQVKENFSELIQQLDNGLRTTFIRETFSFSAQSPDISIQILEKLPGKVILKVLEDLHLADMDVNPRLVQLLDRMAAYEKDQGGFQGARTKMSLEEEEKLKEDTLAFFLPPSETVSEQDADRRFVLLRDLEVAISRQVTLQKDTAGQQDVLAAMDPVSIGEHYEQILLDLLEQSSNDRDAVSYSSLLISVMQEHAALGRWDLLYSVWKQLDDVATRAGEDRLYLAEVCFDIKARLWNVENISTLSSAILDFGWEDATELIDLLRESGSDAGKALVDALIDEENKTLRGIQIRLITELAALTYPYVISRLKDKRWFVVRNMLNILQRIGDYSSMGNVEALAGHPHPKVRLEALRSVARAKNEKAAELVIQAMNDENPEIADGAISIAGLMRDHSVSQALLHVVLDKGGKEFDLARKGKAVKALAMIQDETILPELYKLITARRLFASKEADRLKLEIFRSLGSYPIEKIKPFVSQGLKSNSMEIVDICRSLQRKTI